MDDTTIEVTRLEQKYFNEFDEAYFVLDKMQNIIDKLGRVTFMDYYILCSALIDLHDNNEYSNIHNLSNMSFGWTNIRESEIRYEDEKGYFIRFPRSIMF